MAWFVSVWGVVTCDATARSCLCLWLSALCVCVCSVLPCVSTHRAEVLNTGWLTLSNREVFSAERRVGLSCFATGGWRGMPQHWHILKHGGYCIFRIFMCFVWIWEQTAIISLYSINWLVFITETVCVYCAVRTGSIYKILRSAHTVYLCVLCGSENKQRLFPYTALTDWFL